MLMVKTVHAGSFVGCEAVRDVRGGRGGKAAGRKSNKKGGQQATKQTYAQERRRKTTVAQDTRKDNINIKSRRSLAKLQRVDGF